MAKPVGAISPEEGAKTIIYLASSPDVADVSGEYFYECKLTTPTAEAQNDADAESCGKFRKDCGALMHIAGTDFSGRRFSWSPVSWFWGGGFFWRQAVADNFTQTQTYTLVQGADPAAAGAGFCPVVDTGDYGLVLPCDFKPPFVWWLQHRAA